MQPWRTLQHISTLLYGFSSSHIFDVWFQYRFLINSRSLQCFDEFYMYNMIERLFVDNKTGMLCLCMGWVDNYWPPLRPSVYCGSNTKQVNTSLLWALHFCSGTIRKKKPYLVWKQCLKPNFILSKSSLHLVLILAYITLRKLFCKWLIMPINL